jgi:hypothetical protein
MLPSVVTNNLHELHVYKWLQVFQETRKRIGWTKPNIKRLSPPINMNHILVRKISMPARHARQRWNPLHKDAMHEPDWKLFDPGITFPI